MLVQHKYTKRSALKGLLPRDHPELELLRDLNSCDTQVEERKVIIANESQPQDRQPSSSTPTAMETSGCEPDRHAAGQMWCASADLFAYSSAFVGSDRTFLSWAGTQRQVRAVPSSSSSAVVRRRRSASTTTSSLLPASQQTRVRNGRALSSFRGLRIGDVLRALEDWTSRPPILGLAMYLTPTAVLRAPTSTRPKQCGKEVKSLYRRRSRHKDAVSFTVISVR